MLNGYIPDNLDMFNRRESDIYEAEHRANRAFKDIESWYEEEDEWEEDLDWNSDY